MADNIISMDNSFNLPGRKHGIDLAEVVLKGQKSALEPEREELKPRRRKDQ
jgi:hypothetical protein